MGQKKGYKQTPEHIEHKKRFGKDHHAWKGDQTVDPRARAKQLIKVCGPCELCGTSSKRRERHHKDGNPRNNKRSNLKVLCRKCHMSMDGRLAYVRVIMKEVQKIGTVAAMKTRKNPCGVAGISWVKSRKRWYVRNTEYNKRFCVGYFTDFGTAVKALKARKRKVKNASSSHIS